MKGIRSLDNNEIRSVSTCFTEVMGVLRHSSAWELSPLSASNNFRFKLGGEGSSFSFRHRNSPFCEIVLYHNLGLEGGLNFRWQYTHESHDAKRYQRKRGYPVF